MTDGIRIGIVVMFGALTITACSEQRSARIIDATICSLAAHPKRYENEVVRVRASVRSDGLEHTMLVDGKCPAVRVNVVPISEEPDGDLDELDAAIFAEPRGTVTKSVTGTFVGRFRWHGRKQALSIDLISATNVVTKLRDQGNAAPSDWKRPWRRRLTRQRHASTCEYAHAKLASIAPWGRPRRCYG